MKKVSEAEGCVVGRCVGAVASVNVSMLRIGVWNVMSVRVCGDMACGTECVCMWCVRQRACLCGVGDRVYVHVVCEQCSCVCMCARKTEGKGERMRG